MKWDSNSWARILCSLVAILITAYLYIAKLPPFSLISAREEATTVTGGSAEPAEPPILGGQALIVFMPASLDQIIAADASGLAMETGANSWTKTITLINPSPEPVRMYVFAQGLKNCSETDTKDCVQIPSQVIVGANESTSIEVGFSEISPEASVPVNGKLILAGSGLQQEFPFTIRGAWQKKPTDYQGIASGPLTGGVTLLLVGVVFYLLYHILLTKVSPFFSDKYLTIQTDGNDANKPLWTIFRSRLEEIGEQRVGRQQPNEQAWAGTLVNPRPPAGTIDLPTNLGREGDILRVVIELLNWILPRRGKSIRLQAVESQTNGKGLAVSIVSNATGELLAERVFWSGQYSLDAATNDIEDILMTPVILWLSDWQNKGNGRAFPLWQSSKLGLFKRRQKKTTSDKDWEIKAYCILANRLWCTNRALGKKLYLEVLRHDPVNKQAHLGLGRIWLEESHQNMSPYQHENCLKLAIAYLEEVSARDPNPQDPPWFAAKYSLAVARFYLDDVEGSQKDCDQLFAKLAAIHRRKSGDKADNSEFWLSYTSLPLVFKHSVKLKQKPPKSQEELDEMIKQTITEITRTIHPGLEPNRSLLVNLHYRSQYNLACYFSRCYRLAKENTWPDANKYAELALNYLHLALAHGGGLLLFAQEDRALEPIRADCSKEFDFIVGRKAVSQQPMVADQNVMRVMVEGPILLKSEQASP